MLLESILILTISGSAIAAYWLIDRNKDMERHLHHCEKHKYYVLMLVTSILGLAFAFYTRHVLFGTFKYIKHRFSMK